MEFPIRVALIVVILVIAVIILVILMTRWGGEGATYVDSFIDFFKTFTPSFGGTGDQGGTSEPQGLLPDLTGGSAP